MKHVRLILSIFMSLLKPRHTTHMCRETGKILYHEKEID